MQKKAEFFQKFFFSKNTIFRLGVSSWEIMQQNKLLYVDKKNRVTKPSRCSQRLTRRSTCARGPTGSSQSTRSLRSTRTSSATTGATEQDGYYTGKPKDEMARKSTHLGKKKQDQDDNYITAGEWNTLVVVVK